MQSDALELLAIAKSKRGYVREGQNDEEHRVIFGYVDNKNQIIEMKIPLDGIEIDRVSILE